MSGPPTRLHVQVRTPGGKTHRWAADEPLATDAPTNLSFSSTMPGGFEEASVTLPRLGQTEYLDLEPLSNVRIQGAGGQVVWEGRMEAMPRSSGEEASASPTAVGWQAALEDNANATAVFVDRDLSAWTTMSAARKEALYAQTTTYDAVQDFTLENDVTTGLPELRLGLAPPWDVGAAVEAWYDSGPGNTVSRVYYDYVGNYLASAWVGRLYSYTDDTGSGAVLGTDVVGSTAPSGTQAETPATPERYVAFSLNTGGSGGTIGNNHAKYLRCRRVSVWGTTGVTRQGTAPNDGVYASDVIAYVVRNFASGLQAWTTGPTPSIQATGFTIPHLSFRESTTALEMIQGADRFHHWDWAVWEGQNGPTFYYAPPGGRGARWRTRVGPASLQETGQDVSRVWNGVVVRYQDVDGQTLSVGPTGARTHSTSAFLLDSDPTNPANQAGLTRYAVFELGGVSTAAAATQIGQVLLAQYKLLDQSGSASLTGWVEDAAGRLHPVSQVRAGDYIAFMDAADSSYRRIVRTGYDHDSITNNIDLDAPPEGLDALLERLNVSIVSLGL